MCGVLYKTKDRLLRHVRDKHPKKLQECRWCTYKVGSSLKDRMHQHEKTKHPQQYDTMENRKNRGHKTMENPTLVIPASPVRVPLTVVQDFQDSTPTGVITPSFSPVPITLGIEHHEELSPVKRDLINLFGEGPRKIISPLPETPEKLPSTSENTRTVLKKRDSSHLELPTSSGIQDQAKRFLAPPSLYQTSPEAARALLIRERARKADNYKGTVIPDGFGGVKKVERAYLPDGTIYELTAYWMPDPTCRIMSDTNIPPKETSEEVVDNDSESSDSNSVDESENCSELDTEERKNVECENVEIQTERINVTDSEIQCDIIRVMPIDNY